MAYGRTAVGAVDYAFKKTMLMLSGSKRICQVVGIDIVCMVGSVGIVELVADSMVFFVMRLVRAKGLQVYI